MAVVSTLIVTLVIASVDEAAWISIGHPNAVCDEMSGGGSPTAEVSDTEIYGPSRCASA